MPELPEVETVRRGLLPVFQGQSLTSVSIRRPNLRFPFPLQFAERLRGRTVTAIDRRGKLLLIRLDDGMIWLAHLGMSGHFRVEDGQAGTLLAHDHVVATTAAGRRVIFCDPRRFGYMDLCDEALIEDHPRVKGIGPDPLGPHFSAKFLASRFAGRKIHAKAVLMEQSAVAGMGNIYASESLFRAAISPLRSASSISTRRIGILASAIVEVFLEAIAAGGSSLRDHVLPTGQLGYFQHRFAVYDREGQPCPGCTCEIRKTGGIRRIVLNGRATYFCAQRQR